MKLNLELQVCEIFMEPNVSRQSKMIQILLQNLNSLQIFYVICEHSEIQTDRHKEKLIRESELHLNNETNQQPPNDTEQNIYNTAKSCGVC